MNIPRVVVAACLIAWAALAEAQSQAPDEKKLKDYLVDLSAGHVAAFQIISLDKSAVTDLQTPKDLVAALQAAGDSDSKAGFGIAFSPARSAFGPTAISRRDYADEKKPLTRLWGSTTFSYAQNKKSHGSVDYLQNAVAVHVGYYLSPKQDPLVAGFDAVIGNVKQCEVTLKGVRDGMRADNRRLNERIEAKEKELRRTLTESELDALAYEVLNQGGSAALEKHQMCAQSYVDEVKKRWNASHIDMVLGQGWIKAPTSGAQRLSLGRYAAVALSWAPEEMTNSLFNLTWRRIDREIELDSIATTPNYKRGSTVGARYTYGHGEGRRTYALAEISNVKTGTPTLSNAAFKHAVGIDHKLSEGVWLELRAGRAVTNDGKKIESKALFNLKFSPETNLAKNAGAK